MTDFNDQHDAAEVAANRAEMQAEREAESDFEWSRYAVHADPATRTELPGKVFAWCIVCNARTRGTGTVITGATGMVELVRAIIEHERKWHAR